jgi:hypothetical protein
MIDIRPEALSSDTASALITALNAELRARYPEDGVADTGPFGEYRPSPLNTFMEKSL